MKLEIQKPFIGIWKAAYLVINRHNRRMVCLVKDKHDRTTISYARYLMSVKLGRLLTDHEHVDHIDNDKTNDLIDNLQILTPEENRDKYTKTQPHNVHGTSSMYSNGCRCALCRDWKRLHQTPNRMGEDRICAYCHKHFHVNNKYKKTRFCCQACSNRARSSKQTNGYVAQSASASES